MTLESPLAGYDGTVGPDWINVAAPPVSKETFKAASFRERLRAWNDKIVRDNMILPLPVIIIVYGCLGFLWWYLYRHFFMDHSLTFFSDLNMKRFILYNVLHGILGLGATSGLLGFRFKLAVCSPALHFLRPGTICSPLFPQVAHFLNFGQGKPAKRSPQAAVCYIMYVVSILRALIAEEIGLQQMLPIFVLAALVTTFDFSIWQAGRGEHYGYMMLALAFPDWIHGCQCVQLGLWMWAGVAKIGPWFKHVIPFLTKDSLHTLLMPKGFMAKMMVRDYPQDLNCSGLAAVTAWTACILEIIFPLCCMSPVLCKVGAFGMICYHLFIANTLPFASVMEWNYFCIIMSYYLFVEKSFLLPSSPALIAFLSMVSVVLPILGQLYPNLVPFLVAYRPYMGNWRFAWYVLHKSALSKHARLKTCENPFSEHNAMWFYGLLGSLGKQGYDAVEEWAYILTASILQVAGYRPLISIMEKLCEDNNWSIDDLLWSHSEPYQNQIFGWSLGTGWIAARECVREAYNDICGFNEKEFYMIQFEPAQPFPWGTHAVQYRCFDVTKGPADAQIHGALTYAECENSQPCSLVLQKDQMQSGNSVAGTFLSTYY